MFRIIFIATLATCFSIHPSFASSTEGSRNIAAFVFPERKDTKTSMKKKIAPTATLIAIVASSLALPGEACADGGKELFSNNCASCHLNGQNVMKPERNLQKQTLLKYFGSSGSDILEVDPIVSWIEKSGQHKRLFFPNVPGGKFSSEDYSKVISYIVDQANNDKW